MTMRQMVLLFTNHFSRGAPLVPSDFVLFGHRRDNDLGNHLSFFIVMWLQLIIVFLEERREYRELVQGIQSVFCSGLAFQ